MRISDWSSDVCSSDLKAANQTPPMASTSPMIAITAPRIMAAQFFSVVAVTGSAIGILLGWHSAYSLVQGQTNIGRYLPEHLTCPVVPQQLLSAHQREYPTCQWQPPLKSGLIADDPGWRVACRK